MLFTYKNLLAFLTFALFYTVSGFLGSLSVQCFNGITYKILLAFITLAFLYCVSSFLGSLNVQCAVPIVIYIYILELWGPMASLF